MARISRSNPPQELEIESAPPTSTIRAWSLRKNLQKRIKMSMRKKKERSTRRRRRNMQVTRRWTITNQDPFIILKPRSLIKEK